MEDASLLSPLSLVVIVICLFILNLVKIVHDFCFHLNFSSNVTRFLWRHDKKHSPSVLSETDTETACVRATKTSIEEVKAMIDDSDALYHSLVDGGELFEKNEIMRAEEVEEAFKLFDENGDGFIDEEELRRVMCLLGFDECTNSECRIMIQAFDDNRDGKIDFHEFVKLVWKSFS